MWGNLRGLRLRNTFGEVRDNVVSENDAPATFGIAPMALDEQLRRAAHGHQQIASIPLRATR